MTILYLEDATATSEVILRDYPIVRRAPSASDAR